MRSRYTLLAIWLMALCSSGCQDAVQQHDITQKAEWTEAQKRKYFEDSLSVGPPKVWRFRDSSNDFAHFFKTQYPNIKTPYANSFTYAMEEPIIDTSHIDPARKWFRLTVSPCFAFPYCFVLEKKDDKTLLTVKASNGDGGYFPGTLMMTLHLHLEDTLYDTISRQLHSVDFWHLGKDSACGRGTDGQTWIMEVMENGQYHLVSRWCPEDCGNAATRQLGQIGSRLRTLARLNKLFPALGGSGRNPSAVH